MKLFRFRGGVHPEGHKERSTQEPIEQLPLPPQLYLPVQQHVGEPAKPEVRIGDRVLKGQLLAHSQGMISAPIHAPTSGRVLDIGDFTASHPSGLPVRTVVIEPDGRDRWIDSVAPIDPLALSPEEIAARVGAAGVVGLGGATFPAAVKLSLGLRHSMHTLIINGGECEPYLTCDDRLMRDRGDQVVEGIRIMLHALRVPKALVAIESNKPEALRTMSAAASDYPNIEVVKVPTRYPMGWDKQLVSLLTGREVPAGQRSSDVGVIVHNVATAHAIYRAVRLNRPLVSRIVTVSGDAVRAPKNLEVPLGTLVSVLLDHCGLASSSPRLLMGGPMMGQVLPHSRVPVVKGCNGIIALSAKATMAHAASPCIRCGQCVSACPVGLMPLEMAARIRNDNVAGALDYGLGDCIGCGSCSFVCPAHIPLVQYFNFAKGELAAQRQAQQKAEKTRKLAEARQARVAAAEHAKAEATAKAQQARAERGDGKTEATA